MNQLYKTVYDPARVNGIYCYGLNRFVLIDTDDIWITLKTAQILSSKIVASACVLPLGSSDIINNENCLLHTIISEEPENSKGVSQIPLLRIYNQLANIKSVGLPEEATDDRIMTAITELQEFGRYTNRVIYFLKFYEAMYNTESHGTILNELGNSRWTNELVCPMDLTRDQVSLNQQVQRILYLSNDLSDVRLQLTNMFKTYTVENYSYNIVSRYVAPLVTSFYSDMEEPLPDDLTFMQEFVK
jgi:hypothetical protein